MLSIGVLFLVYALLIFLFVKLTKIIDTLQLEQTKLSSDGLEHVYVTNLITEFSNIIKISVVKFFLMLISHNEGMLIYRMSNLTSGLKKWRKAME